MQVGQQAGVAKQVGKWEKSRPAGVSKLDLTTVWGHAQTPLASLGDHPPLTQPGKRPSIPTVQTDW